MVLTKRCGVKMSNTGNVLYPVLLTTTAPSLCPGQINGGTQVPGAQQTIPGTEAEVLSTQ